MSNTHLQGIANSALDSINRIPDEQRSTYNKDVHIVRFKKNQIKQEIIKELKLKFKKGSDQEKKLDEIVKMYVTEAFKIVQARKSSSVYGYVVLKTDQVSLNVSAGNDFRVLIYGKKGSAIPFAEGTRIQNNAEKLSIVQKEIAGLKQPPERKNVKNRLEALFDMNIEGKIFESGHADRSGIADLVTIEAFGKFSTPSGDMDPTIYFTSTNKVAKRLVAKSITKANKDKKFIMSLIEEAPEVQEFLNIGSLVIPLEPQGRVTTNKALAVIEKRDRAKNRKELIKFVSSKSWATQEASASRVETTLAQITDALVSNSKINKPKVRGTKNRKAKPGDSSDGIAKSINKTSSKEKANVSGSNFRPKITGGAGTATPTSTGPSWSSIINIINRRLPQQVANNMGLPGLVFRTGRLANSSKVVNIESTKEGYPTVVFDYQRDPYDVFDRTRGASPWNTPARDPKTLVDKSVREIMQELAVGRFYTRRAR